MVKPEDYKELERAYMKLLEEKSSLCWFCLEGKLIWQSDFMPEEIGFDEGTEGIVTNLVCSNCGATWEGVTIDED